MESTLDLCVLEHVASTVISRCESVTGIDMVILSPSTLHLVMANAFEYDDTLGLE